MKTATVAFFSLPSNTADNWPSSVDQTFNGMSAPAESICLPLGENVTDLIFRPGCALMVRCSLALA